MINIREIKIEGLFARHDLVIPIKDNKIILVGVNGIGKSSVLNAFYYFISCQWEKLSEINFTNISVLAGRKTLSVSRSETIEATKATSTIGMAWHPSMRRYDLDRFLQRLNSRERDELAKRALENGPTEDLIRTIASRTRAPLSIAKELCFFLTDFAMQKSKTKKNSNILKVEEYLNSNIDGRILYLPTYRRIEKDIKSIFPEIEEEIQRAMRMRRRNTESRHEDVFVELVNFGMEDVYAKINNLMETLRQTALSEVRELTTRYLRDVIRNTGNTYDVDNVKKFDGGALRRIFVNMDESIIRKADQDKITSVVEKIKKDMLIEENEKYVAHYISYLVEIGHLRERRERSVQQFVAICNNYLFGKQIHFDNSKYEVTIQYEDKEQVRMEHLSSGEKQIVSLFAHLIIDESVKNYVIIDEPELSLSVDWQQKFLEDIASVETCHFVGAVTHSPFIFDNSLDSHALDLLSCII